MKLYLGSYFAFFTQDRRHWVEVKLPHPTSLADILARLDVPSAEVHLAVVNDHVLESTDVLVSDEDTVRLFPPIGGG